MNRHAKPPRPLGLTLALLGSTMLFTAIPLFVVGTLLYIHNRVSNPQDGTYIGMSITGLNAGPLIVYAGTGIFFLVMTVTAWRGRHPFIRFIYPLLNVVYGLFTLYAVTSYNASTTLETGIDSSIEYQGSISGFYLALVVGTVVYVCWFMNRWSSRAFYRGYYTPADIALLDDTYRIAKTTNEK